MFLVFVLFHDAEFQGLMGREHNYVLRADDLLAFYVPYFA
jgi:hypothetical protein